MKDIYLIPNEHLPYLNEDMLIEELKRVNKIVRKTVAQVDFIKTQLFHIDNDAVREYVFDNMPNVKKQDLIPAQNALSIINKKTLKYE